LLTDVAVATPKTGVTKVGVLANTSAPVPVSSLTTPANWALVVAANWPRCPDVKARPLTDPPRDIEEPFIEIELLVKAAFPILERVLVAPLIDLLVNVVVLDPVTSPPPPPPAGTNQEPSPARK
jgi:hypothetical protein